MNTKVTRPFVYFVRERHFWIANTGLVQYLKFPYKRVKNKVFIVNI